jgi:NAD(P)-dependent dehydrogenase (short-subunit alcohol dehydrogenase family)
MVNGRHVSHHFDVSIWINCPPDLALQRAKKRIGQPQNVAEAIYAVMTNGFMSGSTLYVDGGQRLT